MQLHHLFLNALIVTISYENAFGSVGDRSQFNVNCVRRCQDNKCQKDGNHAQVPGFALRLLRWDCNEDCRYNCMWEVVDFFKSNGLQIPQFHGKWPFIRILGIQEPASVLFSILNLSAILKMYMTLKRTVFKKNTMFYVWTYFTLVSINAWFWSAIFHTRDTDFTEFMDYASAFTTVLTLLYCLLLRMSYQSSSNFIVFAITCLYISLLYTHITYLWSGRINYDYNMKFNIALGFVTFTMAMIWWYKNSKKLPHSYLIGRFTVLSVLVTLLEVLDFAPIFWIFDAHSLWHASTIPLIPFLYRFMIEDCIYLDNYRLKLQEHVK